MDVRPGAVERRAVADLVLACLRELLAMEGADVAANEETPLIGAGAVLDSLGLVALIVDVEQRLKDEHGIVVTIADERAMSQRRSPFRTAATLIEYVRGLLGDARRA